MNITFIIDTFIKALYGVPVTLGIMVVAILLSFLPALFLALGQIYKLRGVKTFSIVYLAQSVQSPSWRKAMLHR